MSQPQKALFLAALFAISMIQIPNQENTQEELSQNLFNGFSIQTDIWNESPLREIAVPEGFNLSTAVDYSDVGVLINNKSEISRTIGWAFVTARNISADRVFIFDNSSNPTGETINRNQFDSFFLEPFKIMLSNYNGTDLNYLVTTKGMPLRINGGNNKASFDQEIALAGGAYDSDIGSDWWSNHNYGPLAGKQMEEFTRDEYGFFLVTRLTGYTVETALDLIEKANNSYGARGTHVLDLATNRNESGYQFWNDDLYVANTTLNDTMNLPVYFDEETEFITNVSNVIGYASWGSNDGNWNLNYLANGGFDTLDSSWSSGSRYWNISAPTVSPGDVFNWSYQTSAKQGGNGAFEATISTSCTQDSGYLRPGIFAEYFDNEGVSFNSATMPELIDRIPDHSRLEPDLAYSSSGNPYPGLDDRFKNNWGARFSGLINIPETGNWKFYLNSDDGSELWINDISTIQNYGMHGMREISSSLNLTAGYHDFRVEFFQGNGPHGLKLSWEGPNVSKATIPPSAFVVQADNIPQSENLIHQWDFEEGSGSFSSDSITNSSNFTLYGMNSSNWRNCVDGNCLWFDGVDDYAQVNVDDWLGNFSVSQWVLANTTSLPTYASTFAIDNNAGSNQSFQHMVSGGKWRLHNNQTMIFGDVIAQKWTHLVTVYDAGNVRQYMDGVLVNSNFYPNGSLNNFDLYKIGVNRAGNAHFEGLIDSLMIWDTALKNSSITSLNRDIINNCTAYSGNGQNVAYLETTHQIPVDFTNHVWNVHAYGKRTGDVFGEFRIQVTSFDANGAELSYNESSRKDYKATWDSQAMRFRPHEDATSMKIRISLDIVPTSTDGSLFVDSAVLRVIRPHMNWVNGSIVETAVSTGARSFNWGTSYGQSLVADILEDGASGIKGYVYEPYLTSVSYPSVLLSSYASGYTLAESYAAANTKIGWMGVVVGDPKMSPYADIVHDIRIVDVRVTENLTINSNCKIEIAIENIGPGIGVGNLKILDKLGSIVLTNHSMVLPSGSENGSRQIIELSINTSREGWNNLVIKWEATSLLNPERNIDNNQFDLTIWANSPPVVENIYCDSTQYSRGDRFVCSIEATDDSAVVSATISWRITSGNNSSEWIVQGTGSQDGYIWWTTIDLPTNVELGMLDIMATTTDESNISTIAIASAVAQIRDAPAFWFGVHISGVDDSDWGGASVLTSFPNKGVLRGHILTLKACVLDPDHSVGSQAPMISATRGNIDGLSYLAGNSPEHHCYIASFTIPTQTSLSSFKIELRNSEGVFMTQRTIQVADESPEVEIRIVNGQNETVENVLGGGEEYIQIIVTDYDDSIEGVYGDVSIHWPGQSPYSLPVEFDNGVALFPLATSQTIENGELTITANITGANGASSSASIQTPIVLSPPEILTINLCQEGDAIDELMFGQTADAVVRVRSSRQIQDVSATLEQLGWIVSAPDQGPTTCGIDLAEQNAVYHFRIQLDSSFVPGNGTLGVRVMDIDEIVSISYLTFEFLHSPPVIAVEHPSNISNAGLLEILVEMNDADGIDAVCMADYYQDNSLIYSVPTREVIDLEDSGFWSSSWLLPTNITGNISLKLSCEDWSGNQVSYNSTIYVDNPIDCVEECSEVGDETKESSQTISLPLVAGLGIVVSVLIGTIILRGRKKEDESEAWHDEEIAPTRDERIPEGWTLEEFLNWLDGPMPEDWQEDQWELYKLSLDDLR